nr:AMP-binding protein [Streptomyces sp. San01]
MHWETIHKDITPGVTPNLTDYDRARSDFSWSRARATPAGLPGGGLNVAHEAVDRHAGSDHRDKVALRCVARDNSVSTVTYAELAHRTDRFANVLRSLGVGRGDRVFTLLGRCPELYTAVLGTLKNTSVLCPLFSAFGPDPVGQRLRLGDARVLVTTAALPLAPSRFRRPRPRTWPCSTSPAEPPARPRAQSMSGRGVGPGRAGPARPRQLVARTAGLW